MNRGERLDNHTGGGRGTDGGGDRKGRGTDEGGDREGRGTDGEGDRKGRAEFGSKMDKLKPSNTLILQFK